MKKLLATRTIVLLTLLTLTTSIAACTLGSEISDDLLNAKQEATEAVENLTNEATDAYESVENKIDEFNQAAKSVSNAMDAIQQAKDDIGSFTGSDDEDEDATAVDEE